MLAKEGQICEDAVASFFTHELAALFEGCGLRVVAKTHQSLSRAVRA